MMSLNSAVIYKWAYNKSRIFKGLSLVDAQEEIIGYTLEENEIHELENGGDPNSDAWIETMVATAQDAVDDWYADNKWKVEG